jgi:FlaA1/EpsC-like NDP-sugar epimerase
VLLGHGENSIFDVEQDLRRAFPGLHIVPFIADIRDARRLRAVFQAYRPDIVFHAAAHKHVPLMEGNPDEAITNNVLGTARVAQALEAGSERFVLISSDKAVSPTSVMGASKRLAEEFIRAVARVQQRAFVVVRFGNVLGSRGSVVPFFQKQIERGGPVTITHPEMGRFFMTIPEAVHLVLQAGGLAVAERSSS